MPVSTEMREEIVARARGQCEYCQTQQSIVIAMEVNHIIPRSAGRESTLNNLCLMCVGGNRPKAAAQTSNDPLTNEEVVLFNPRIHDWYEHFEWNTEGTHVNPLSPTGRVTVERLKLNRDEMVAARKIWVAAGWHPPTQG